MGVYFKAGHYKANRIGYSAKDNFVDMGMYAQTHYNINNLTLFTRSILGFTKHNQVLNISNRKLEFSPPSFDFALEAGVDYPLSAELTLSPSIFYQLNKQSHVDEVFILNDKFKVKENNLKLQEVGINLNLSYKINATTRAAGNIRYIRDRFSDFSYMDNNIFLKEDNRFNIDFSLEQKIKSNQKLSLSLGYSYWNKMDIRGVNVGLNYNYSF